MKLEEIMKNERTKQGISQNQLAEAAGVTKRAISYWENGNKKMNVESADRIFKALNISVTIGKCPENLKITEVVRMNNTKIGTSMDDTKDLRKIILENPELPLVIFAGEESYCGEYPYNLAEIASVKIKELTFEGEWYIEKEVFRNNLFDRLDGEYDTNEKLEHAVDIIMNETEFIKAIVVYVG